MYKYYLSEAMYSALLYVQYLVNIIRILVSMKYGAQITENIFDLIGGWSLQWL